MWAKTFWNMLETLRNVGITPFLRMVVLQQVEGRTELRVGWKMAALPCGSRTERLFSF
uniref:Uncharacterized protein n=1 Tax=Siphoviridae sp. ctZgu8 TaxID=2827893 RepID=A0A8S5SLP3_9CAUD|nr:MAG TPA: hypothetical protein [Siphoviridae sp. ctZgu8]